MFIHPNSATICLESRATEHENLNERPSQDSGSVFESNVTIVVLEGPPRRRRRPRRGRRFISPDRCRLPIESELTVVDSDADDEDDEDIEEFYRGRQRSRPSELGRIGVLGDVRAVREGWPKMDCPRGPVQAVSVASRKSKNVHVRRGVPWAIPDPPDWHKVVKSEPIVIPTGW